MEIEMINQTNLYKIVNIYTLLYPKKFFKSIFLLFLINNL